MKIYQIQQNTCKNVILDYPMMFAFIFVARMYISTDAVPTPPGTA